MFKRILFLVTLAVVPLTVNAQRLIDGQPLFSVQGGTVFPVSSNPFIPQGHLGYGGCTHYGKWLTGVTVGWVGMNYQGVYEKNDKITQYNISTKNFDLSADGAYLLRIATNRSRSVCFWGGLGVSVGARLYGSANPSFIYDFDGKKVNVPTVRFQYGFYPRFDLEFFLSKSLSLDLYTRLNFMMRVSGKNDSWFKDSQFFFPEAGLALNVYFFYE